MASWWTAADMLDSLDLEENSIVSRVIQAVGLFGDILSLEDTMEPILSEAKREDGVDNTEGTEETSVQEAGDKQVEMIRDEVTMEEDGEDNQQVGDSEDGNEKEREDEETQQAAEKEEEVKKEDTDGSGELEKEKQVEVRERTKKMEEKIEGETEEKANMEKEEEAQRGGVEKEREKEEQVCEVGNEEEEKVKDEGEVEEKENEKEMQEEEIEGREEEQVLEKEVEEEKEEGMIEAEKVEEKAFQREQEKERREEDKTEEEEREKEADEEEGGLKEEESERQDEEEVEDEEQKTREDKDLVEKEVIKEGSEGYKDEDEERDEERKGQDREEEAKDGETELKMKKDEEKEEGREDDGAEKEKEEEEVDEGQDRGTEVKGHEEEMMDKEEKELEKEASVDGEGKWEPNDEPANQLHQPGSQQSSSSSLPLGSEVAETLSHDGAETGDEALKVLTDEDKDSGAAKNHNGDVYPASASEHNEMERAQTASLTDTNLPPVDARLNLSVETQSLEERELFETSLTSFPAPGEAASEDNIRDFPPEPQTDLQASGCRSEEKVALMDAAAQSSLRAGPGSKEPSPTRSSSSAGNPVVEVRVDKEDKEEGGQTSHKMNGKADAADDKKNGSRQSAKYKSVSYRKIRRGNTRQRIDEFESMMNL